MFSIYLILSPFYWCLRPLIKWFLRKTTKLCELQRICYGVVPGAARTLAVEASLKHSRNAALRNLPYLRENKNEKVPFRVALLQAVNTVITAKKINEKFHMHFLSSFSKCMGQIYGYISFVEKIEKLRQTSYDSNNLVHEKKLLKLWSLLVPDTELESRITKQWQFIGFQGDDPKTDFRGMGMLGLENLLFFASEYQSIAQRILLKSQHPVTGYAFAIIGINLTHLTYCLVKDGAAKTHLYNVSRSPFHINCFHHLYCCMYVEFDKFWTSSKPKNIMDFSSIRDKFEKNIRESLRHTNTVFKINAIVDKI